jgi:hypothetical protein
VEVVAAPPFGDRAQAITAPPHARRRTVAIVCDLMKTSSEDLLVVSGAGMTVTAGVS